MRWANFGIWMLLNLMLMGTTGYIYLMWVQFWKYSSKTPKMAAQKDKPNVIRVGFDEIIMREGRPRIKPRVVPTEEYSFLYPQYGNEANSLKEHTQVSTPSTTTTTLSPPQLTKAVEKHRIQLTVQLRAAQMDGGNTLLKHENIYGVKYHAKRFKGVPTRALLRCAFSKVDIRGLRDGDEPFTSEGMGKYFPHQDILEGRYYNTCAVVTSAGALRRSNLGKFIDSHDMVVRFNHAPTKSFEKDVGTKTNFRIINSQVVTKPEFNFWSSSLYKNVTLLVWDPSNYTHSLAEWYGSPDFPVFSEYFRRRLMVPKEELHLLHPGSLWNIWDTMQMYTHTRLTPNPPSSGFLGMILMLHHCQVVNVMEYIPSIRVSKQCHYWDRYKDDACTYGGWHPLATEKLLTLMLNTASDHDTYVKGYISIPGFNQGAC